MSRKVLLVLCAAVLAGCSSSGVSFVKPKPTEKTDTGAPYINISQYVYETPVGHPIDFSNITGYDDVDGLMPVSVEGYIDYGKPGEYYPKLVCTDTSGNESEVAITVDVVEEVYSSEPPAAVTDFNSTPAPTASSCDAAGAKDSGLPCTVLVPADIAAYETIYKGEEGLTACQAAAAQESAETPGAVKSCEQLSCNDGSFWGYGLKTAATQ
jgi:hypothetical protein